MSQVTDEVDEVFDFLKSRDIGISYNDGTGIPGAEYTEHFWVSIPEADGGGTHPADVAKEVMIPILEEAFAETELEIRSAQIYKDINLDPDNDRYGYYVNVIA